MWAPPKVILFLVFVRTVAALECEVCFGVGKNCTGSMKACLPGQDTCVIVLAVLHFSGEEGDVFYPKYFACTEGRMVQTVAKGCETSTICNSPLSEMNMGEGKVLQTSLVCCREKTCQRAYPRLLPMETKLNGKQCPACYSWTVPCNPIVLNCTGTEEYCFEVSSRFSVGERLKDLNMKGCTTKSVCNSINHGDTPRLEAGDAVLLKAHCDLDLSSGSHSSGLLLLTFFGLLLLKILS